MSKGAGTGVAIAAQIVRLLVPAGKATAAPPIGPALGARGVKSMDFCKEFNARTSHLNPGTPTPVDITIQPDRTFTFVVKSPPTSFLIKQAAGIENGTGEPGKIVSGSVSIKHLYEIALLKQGDEHLRNISLESICKSVMGSAKSMGVKVIS